MMPELPEVETIRRQLGPLVTGRTVVEADGHPSEKFVSARDCIGATMGEVRRRGKYLLIDLTGGSEPGRRELVVHLGMTGMLLPTVEPDDPYVRARWFFDDRTELVFRDVRRFGRIRVVPAGDHSTIATLAKLGPEPLADDFDPEDFYQALRRSKRRVKTQLLSQVPVAGVGNIYADEALWRARIRPSARRVTRAEATRLHGHIRDVLAAGIANGGTTLRDYRTVEGAEGTNQFALDCYGRAGEPCRRCASVLTSRQIDARTTTWCPACQ